MSAGLGFQSFGSGAFGALDDELVAASSGPVAGALAASYVIAWRCLFARLAEPVVFRREQAPPLAAIRVNTRAVFRAPREAELIGNTVKATDIVIIVDPAPLIAAGIALPTRHGDKIVRLAGTNDESLFTASAPPVHLRIGGGAVAVRMIAQGV